MGAVESLTGEISRNESIKEGFLEEAKSGGQGHGQVCVGLARMQIESTVSLECQHWGYIIMIPKPARNPTKQPSSCFCPPGT